MATVRTRSYFTNLFITGYKPSQTNYADLFLTVPMKKEVADRARVTTGSASLETEVGLVVLATDVQAKANTAQLSDRSLVTQPHQLPTVEAIANSTTEDMPTTGFLIDAAAGTTTRNRYQVRFLGSWLTWLISRIFKAGGTAGQVPVKVDGTDYNWGWSTLTIAQTSGTVPINRGGTGETTATLAINALLPSKTGNTLKVLRVNAGETDVEWATNTGEANTASSAGGTSLYKTKTGVDLIFKGLTAGTGVTLTSNTNDVAIGLSWTVAWTQILVITATDYSAVGLYYTKDPFNNVNFKGYVLGDGGITGGQTQTLFTLPAGYRPSFPVIIPAVATSSGSGFTVQRQDVLIEVGTDGVTKLNFGSVETNFNNYIIYLSPIHFVAEA